MYYKTAVLLKFFDFSYPTCFGVKSVFDIIENPFGYFENYLLSSFGVIFVVSCCLRYVIFRWVKKIFILAREFQSTLVFNSAEHCPYVCFAVSFA